jgi:hypothetical protein
MAASAFNTFGRWAAAALGAVALSLAHAQPPHAPHAPLTPRASFTESTTAARASARAPEHPAGVTASRRAARRQFAVTVDPYGHGGPRLAPAASAAPAGPFYRPVSEEARTLAREGGAAYLRAGSIRSDIARYNEERGVNRAPHPPATGARSSESPPVYRN